MAYLYLISQKKKKMKNNEKEIIEKCRKLVIPAESALLYALANFRTHTGLAFFRDAVIQEPNIMDVVNSIRLIGEIKVLLGYKEDEKQGKLEQLKFNYGEDSRTQNENS